MEALRVDGVYKIYKERELETVALRDVALTVQPGEFVAVRGRSGSGKSTLLNLLAGLDLPSAGRIQVAGMEITQLGEAGRARVRGEVIGIVYQKDNLIPFLTALENVVLPAQCSGRRHAETTARALLNEVGLSGRLQHKPAMLSGGERQRVAIAAALVNNPQILLADELTGELDSATADRIMGLLAELNRERALTAVVVTHNAAVAARAQRQIALADGQLHELEAIHA